LRDFLSKLLAKDYSRRLSAEEALKHPWILHNSNLSVLNLHYSLAQTKEHNDNNNINNNCNNQEEPSRSYQLE